MEDVSMGRTNVVLDDKLVAKCQKATGIKTRRALVQYALEELLRQQNQKKILELEGKIHWEGDLDAWRTGRFQP
jgi:Arc/MetJ family transcription regulator